MHPLSDGDPAHPAPPGTGSLPRRAASVLLLGFCCWHAVFLITSILPQHQSREEAGNAARNLYQIFVSGRQQWNVFETIPLHHSLEARIVVDDGPGGRATVGSILPGLTPYPQPENARYYNLFSTMLLNSPKPSYFESYLRRTEETLRARHGGATAVPWVLVVDVEWTRTLIHSRRGGGLYVPATRSFDVANPGGISP